MVTLKIQHYDGKISTAGYTSSLELCRYSSLPLILRHRIDRVWKAKQPIYVDNDITKQSNI